MFKDRKKQELDHFDCRDGKRFFECVKCRLILSVEQLNTVMRHNSEGIVHYYCDVCIQAAIQEAKMVRL